MDSLNAVLKKRALELGMCRKFEEKWTYSWDDSELCRNYKQGIDFCIENDFPSPDFIRSSFNKDSLKEFGIFIDHSFNPESATLPNGTYVILGESKGIMKFGRWSAAMIYVRHNSDIKIEAGDFSKITVIAYEDSSVEVIGAENAKIKFKDKRP